MKTALLCLLACTAAGTAAGLLILLLKKLFRDKLSPIWHCYVWLLVMTFFMVPVLIKPELPKIQLPQWEQSKLDMTEEKSQSEYLQAPQFSMESTKPVDTEQSKPAQSAKNETSSPLLDNSQRDEHVDSDVSAEESSWYFVDPVNVTDPIFEALFAASQEKNKSEENYATAKLSAFVFPVWGWQVLVLIWLGGSICFLGKQWYLYYSFTKALKEHSEEASEEEKMLLKQVEESLSIRRPVKLARTSLPISPMLVGIRRSTLYLPKENLSPRQLSLVFVHELTHYRYHDLLYKELALLIRGLHWFNPLTYFMVEDIDFSCELCCDRRVRRHIGDENAKEYSTLLLELLRNEFISAPAVGFSMDKSSLKRRLSLIVKPKNTSKALSILLSLFIALGGAACSSTIAPTIRPEDLSLAKLTGDQSGLINLNNINNMRLPYTLTRFSDTDILPLERYTALSSDIRSWVDFCKKLNNGEQQAYALVQRINQYNHDGFIWLIYDENVWSNDRFDHSSSYTADAQGVHVNILTSSIHPDGTKGIQKIKYLCTEGEAPEEIPTLNYSVDGISVPCHVIEVPWELDLMLDQDASNEAWGVLSSSGDKKLKGLTNVAVHSIAAYLDKVPEASDWVKACQESNDGKAKAIVSKQADGANDVYTWLVYDPTVRMGSKAASDLHFNLLENYISFSIYENMDENAPVALQTVIVSGIDFEETPQFKSWHSATNEDVYYEVEEVSFDLNPRSANTVMPRNPVPGAVLKSVFDSENGHEGIDLAAVVGKDVHASDYGTVTYAGVDEEYGNKLVIDHGYGWESIYRHCGQLFVNEGDKVIPNEKITAVVEKNSFTEPYIHFELRKNGVAVDPLNYFHEMAYGYYHEMSVEQSKDRQTVSQSDITQLSFNSNEIITYQDYVNSDVVGWLQIPNLDICEPVLQTDNNNTYSLYDIYNNRSSSGAIYGDFECKMDGVLRSDNTIIYGNNLANTEEPYKSYNELDNLEMFEKLSVLHNYSVAKRTPFIHYSTSEADYVWQIFAVLDAPVDLADKLLGRVSNSDLRQACENSIYDYGVNVNSGDMILTLCTDGSNSDERFVVMAKRVPSETRSLTPIGLNILSK